MTAPTDTEQQGCGGRGPYICAYPDHQHRRFGERWTCPECGARYVFARQGADHGYWRWTFWSKVAMGLRGRA